MRLFEFADDDPLRVKLMGVVKQLQARMENSNIPIPLDVFLDFLNRNGISVDKTDIYDLIKKEPLVNLVQSIEDNNVVFKGSEVEAPPEEGGGDYKKIRQQMASKQVA